MIFTFSGFFNADGPDINVVLTPNFASELAISYPCLPLELLVIKLTGSMYSFVGPAVTSAFKFLFLTIFRSEK